jgi:hypothetical protein
LLSASSHELAHPFDRRLQAGTKIIELPQATFDEAIELLHGIVAVHATFGAPVLV